VRGALAGLVVAIVVDLWGTVAFGSVATTAALALALALAPPRVFELLRASSGRGPCAATCCAAFRSDRR